MKKRVIWSNIDLNPDDWKEGYEEFIEMNELDLDPNDENALWEWMEETNAEYLDDERTNLNKDIPGRILVIGELGLWDGKKVGYKIINRLHPNLNDFLEYKYDYAEFYGDGKDIRGTEIHHDGTNHYLYRIIREDRNIDAFLELLIREKTYTRHQLAYYTSSLWDQVAEVYGW